MSGRVGHQSTQLFRVLEAIPLRTQSAAVLPTLFSGVSRRRRMIAVAASVALVCSGTTSCTNTQVGLSIGAVAAVVVGVTVGVTLAVQHSHHTLQGCIVTGVDGMELRLSNGNAYTLKGELTDIKVGDKLSVHGSKLKKVNGGSAAGDPVFVVEKVNKDYGACPANFGSAAGH
jgi:hypothetical protein